MNGRNDVRRGTEQRRIVVINRPLVSPQTVCDKCVELSGMISPDEAAAIYAVSTRTIYRWLETRRIHFSETTEGVLLICLNSLAVAAVNDRAD